MFFINLLPKVLHNKFKRRLLIIGNLKYIFNFLDKQCKRLFVKYINLIHQNFKNIILNAMKLENSTSKNLNIKNVYLNITQSLIINK